MCFSSFLLVSRGLIPWFSRRFKMFSNTIISSSRTVIQTLGLNLKIVHEHRKIHRDHSPTIPTLPQLPLGKQKCIYNRATFDAAAVLAYCYKSGCPAAGVPTEITGRIQSTASGKHLLGVAFLIPRSEWDGTDHPLPPGPPVIGVAVKQRMHKKKPALDVLVPFEFNDRSVFKWTVSRIAEFRAQSTQSSPAQPSATLAGSTPAPQPAQPRQPSPSVTPPPELPVPAANSPTAASPSQQKERIVVYGLGHRVNDSLPTAMGKFSEFSRSFLHIESLDGVRALETLVSHDFFGRSRSVLVLEVPHTTRKAIWCAKSRLPGYIQVSIDYHVDHLAHRARIAQRRGPAVQHRSDSDCWRRPHSAPTPNLIPPCIIIPMACPMPQQLPCYFPRAPRRHGPLPRSRPQRRPHCTRPARAGPAAAPPRQPAPSSAARAGPQQQPPRGTDNQAGPNRAPPVRTPGSQPPGSSE